MAKFIKVISKPGTYMTSTASGGRKKQVLTTERYKKWIANFQKMQAKGHRLPAPWKHDLGINALNQELPATSDQNAGFWENLFIDGEGQFCGVIDAPGDEKDFNTPAGKVGKTVKECSVYALPDVVDGSGEHYDEALMHIAVVVNPIEGGQSNFIPIPESIAMSQFVGNQPDDAADSTSGNDPSAKPPKAGQPIPEGDSGAALAELLEVLRGDNIGIDLPENTSVENFIQFLLIAARQKATQPSSDLSQLAKPKVPNNDPTKKPGEGSVTQPTAITMSQTPATPATPSNEILMSQIEGLKQANSLLAQTVTSSEKDKRAVRIQRLAGMGLDADYIKNTLNPMLEGFQMSFDASGKIAPNAIDVVLEGLELGMKANPAPSANPAVAGIAGFSGLPAEAQLAISSILMSHTAGLPAGSQVQSHGNFLTAPNEPLDGEKAAEVANQFLKNMANR